MRRLAELLVSAAALLAAGCSITGKWSLAAVEPEAARRDIEFGSLTLQEDGSFYGESQTGEAQSTVVRKETSVYAETRVPGIRTTSGTYSFRDGTLTLRPHDGPAVAYDAAFRDAKHLQLTKFWQGQKVRAVFKKVE